MREGEHSSSDFRIFFLFFLRVKHFDADGRDVEFSDLKYSALFGAL